MPIQGTAADVLKKAMIDVHAALERFNLEGGGLDGLSRPAGRSPAG